MSTQPDKPKPNPNHKPSDIVDIRNEERDGYNWTVWQRRDGITKAIRTSKVTLI